MNAALARALEALARTRGEGDPRAALPPIPKATGRAFTPPPLKPKPSEVDSLRAALRSAWSRPTQAEIRAYDTDDED